MWEQSKCMPYCYNQIQGRNKNVWKILIEMITRNVKRNKCISVFEMEINSPATLVININKRKWKIFANNSQ